MIAAGAGADMVMLDNFTPEPEQLKKNAKSFKEKYPHIDTMAEYFSKNVDVISQGKLMQGCVCVDFSLKIVH